MFHLLNMNIQTFVTHNAGLGVDDSYFTYLVYIQKYT